MCRRCPRYDACGAMGMKLVPAGYFSVFASTGFNVVPGIHLFYMQNEAWLDEINRIVSFHEISDSRYYSAEEHDFWQMIVSLILAGYRVQ